MIVYLASKADIRADILSNRIEEKIHNSFQGAKFIDASGLFKKETKNNTLTDDRFGRIMEIFDPKEKVPHSAASVDHVTVAKIDRLRLNINAIVDQIERGEA